MENNELEDLINEYLNSRPVDLHIRDCASLTDIENVIELAATSRNLKDKKHSHQYRIPNKLLDDFAINIISKKGQLLIVESFEDLLNIIIGCKVKGVGELTIYDTAERIGHFLNLFPDKIYLHCGVRSGAKILLGSIPNKFLTIEQFPSIFIRPDFSSTDIENFLCIYKNRFKKSNDKINVCHQCFSGTK